MYQTLHIFKKDARYLWREICLFLTLAALFAWLDQLWVEVLLPVTAVYIIARLIHAEPLPGDTQFWVTRPYRWQSLLAAKLLFILVVLNIPVLLTRISKLMDGGYLLSEQLSPLLWSQLLMMVAFCLPVAAVAAVTADTVPFFFSTLILLVAGFAVATLPAARVVVWNQSVAPWPEGVTWLRAAFVFAFVTIAAVYVLAAQYKTRRTRRNRTVAALVLMIAAVGNFTISPSLAVQLHTRLSSAPSFAPQVRVNVDTKPRKFAFPKRDTVQLSIPLNVIGIPPELEAHADGVLLSLEGSTGRWETFTIPSPNPAVADHALDSTIFVDPSFFAAERQHSIRLHGSLYMTVFGGGRSTDVTLTTKPLNVGNGLQCFVNDITSQLHCRSAFRWPRLLVLAKVRNEKESMWPLISYSPFPSGIELNYVEEHRASGPPPHAPQATILMMEPQSHFRTDFVIENLNMDDFTRDALPPADAGLTVK